MPKPLTSERGAALLAALCFAAVLAIALGSYITLCHRSLEMSTRNMSSTHSVELAEVGMEEALWALNKNDWDPSRWTINGTTATRTLSGFAYDNGVTGSVVITVTNYDGSLPTDRTITVTGTTTTSDGTTSSRTLTSTSAKTPLFVNAVAATTGRVRFRVAGTVDSYDSSRGDYSSQTPTYSAVLSSGMTGASSATVVLTDTNVKGYTASLFGIPGYGTGATLRGPNTPVSTKIDSARISTSVYQPIFEENVPTGTMTLLPTGTATIGTPGATTPELYYATTVSLSGTQILTVDGPVKLVISGDLLVTTNAKIHVTTNGSLEIHLAGDMTLKGNGIQNDTKLPRKLIIQARADNVYDSLEMTNTTPFYGVIYTPYNALTVGSSQTIYGSIVAKSVTFNASPTIHYDVDLRDSVRGVFDGIITPYAVSSWRETSQ
ncbi:MAG: hypothetical protein HZA93_22150 [Verrucomicrobia bacterium]|nr:hypothetical protein [Verrucomicrobiota bacterium]